MLLVAAGAAAPAILVVFIVASRGDAGEVLPKGDTRLFRNTGGIGIDCMEKILDFLLNIHLDAMNVRAAW